MMKIWILLFGFLFANFTHSQQTDYVDFKKASAEINFDVLQKKVYGKIAYNFNILKSCDSIYLDLKNARNLSVRLLYDDMTEDNHYNGQVDYNLNKSKVWIKHHFVKGKWYHVLISYFLNPKQALYFLKKDNDTQIWTQGQGKYTSHWLPSIDDVNDKIEFDLTIIFDKEYQVISNGKRLKTQPYLDKQKWYYDMKQPMSSYLVALAIGKYDKIVEYSKEGIPLEMYYYPKDSLKVEPTYRYTKQMFDFFEEEIGVPYPWQNYKQVPVHDFLYAGMENTSCTIFSDAFMVDHIGFNDKNYINVNAHELAHQWFGNLITAKNSKDHWLQEGFATYYALLAEQMLFGTNYYHFQLYQYAVELQQQDMAKKGTSLINPKASSTTFYKRGAWVLHMLRLKIGDEAFMKAVKNYLNRYEFSNVETIDFLNAIDEETGENIEDFVKLWIEAETFPFDEAIESLKNQSTYINEYLMVDCEVKNSKCNEYLTSWISDEAKIKIIKQDVSLVTKEVFKNSVKVRQAIAQYVRKIPKEFKSEYENLLQDNSYVTIEHALFNLTNNFPENSKTYLEKTKHIIGLNNKNVRQLWLFLAIILDQYDKAETAFFFNELMDYTSPKYHFEVRQLAFQYLNAMYSCNEDCKKHLEAATTHHNWRFRTFAKTLIDQKK